jgi:uncharacterized protein YjdB
MLEIFHLKNSTMMNKLLHTFVRKGEKNKHGGNWIWQRILFLLFFVTAFSSAELKAQITPTIDGNPIEWNRALLTDNFNLFAVKKYAADAYGNGVVDNQFTEGSKDFFLANQLVWSISQTKAKNDIANGAAIIQDNILYFAGDRTSNNGDAQIGFWLYLNGTAPTTIGGNNIFSPPHVDGDVLVLADFTGGGRNATVVIYQWYSGANPLPPGTSIVPNTNGNLRTSTLVGTVAENNDGQYPIPTGWSFPSATYDYNQFYEGQVNLTGLGFTGANLCNATFLLETRSSQSITASLDDFVGGNFNITPPALILSGSSICIGSTGTISSTTSQDGASYQLYNSADQPVGSIKIGDGSGLTWTDIAIGEDYYVVGIGTLPVCTSTSNEVDVTGIPGPDISNNSVCVGGTVDMGPNGTWTSSNTAVATVTNEGVVTGVSAGTATIRLTNASGCYDEATITVNANPDINNNSVCVGSTVDMGPTGTWTSSNTAVATVTNEGVVTGVSAGTATIRLTNASGCYDEATITVNANPDISNNSVCVGGTVDMGPTGTWTSSNTAVATVTNEGVVTGVSAGSATIRLTNGSGCYDEATITVNANPDISNNSVCVGSTVDMGPTGTWTSSNTAVATVTNEGVVTGVSAGSATIRLTNGSGCYDEATITVNANPDISNNSVCVGSTVDMGPTGTWTSSNTAVATVTNEGVVTGVSAGSATIRLTNASGCYDEATITVNAKPDISNNSVCVGGTVDMGPTGTWTSSNTAVATVTNEGVVTGVSAGSATIRLTNASGCYDEATVTVNPLPIISCSASPTQIDIMSAAHNSQLDVDLSANADTDPTHYSYVWTEDGAGSFNFTDIKNPVYTAGLLDAAQTVSFTVTVTNLRTGCVSTSNCSLTVNTIGSCPGVPTAEICNGSTNEYTADRAPSANETWLWSVNNGASIDGADNAQTVKVIAGGQSFTLTLTISYANTDISPSVCTYEVSVVSCGGYCTYTQGKYGNTSPACDGDGIGDGVAITYPTVADMIKAMLGVGGVANPLVIGSNGKFITIPSTASAAELLNKSMPGGGGSRELFGSCTVDNVPLPACWTPGTNNSTTYITKQGRINNVLLSQTITLGLNLRVSGGLGDFALEAGTFATAKAVGGCGSTTAAERRCELNELGVLVVVNEYVYKTIPQSIIDALTAGGYDLTVGGLYDLANDALGNLDGEVGKERGASLGTITDAVASINEGFDECRISMGWDKQPLNCVVSTRININPSGAINSADVTALSVESLRVSAYPNPFAEKVSFAIVSPVSGKASLEIYNMFGQKLQTVYEGYLTAGRTQLVEFRPGSTIAAGTLVYRLNVAGKQVTGKLVNIKH